VNGLVKVESDIVLPVSQFTPVGWIPLRDLSYEEWYEEGRKIAYVSDAVNWWIGDWLIYGQFKSWGDRYAQAYSLFGDKYELSTLNAFAYVSRHIEMCRRLNILSWAHHYQVAKKDADTQDALLSFAATRRLSVRDLQSAVREYERNAWAIEGDAPSPSSAEMILCGDFIQACSSIADSSIDLIFTDPPYDDESVWMYEPLATIAARILKPGGSLITYAGHHALPAVLPLMTPYLRFWWTLAVHHNGSAARLPGKWVFVHWKPLLWFVKGSRRRDEFVADFVESHQPDKNLHDWEQDVSEASYYIEHLTRPGEMVLDPFCGSGTTCVAALQLSRRTLGIEVEEGRAQVARRRVDDYLRATRDI